MLQYIAVMHAHAVGKANDDTAYLRVGEEGRDLSVAVSVKSSGLTALWSSAPGPSSDDEPVPRLTTLHAGSLSTLLFCWLIGGIFMRHGLGGGGL